MRRRLAAILSADVAADRAMHQRDLDELERLGLR